MTEAEKIRGKTPSKNDLKRHSGEKPSNLRVLKPGVMINPLTRLPRNMKCPCFSGKKFKACCYLETQPYIDSDHLDSYLETFQKALDGKQAW